MSDSDGFRPEFSGTGHDTGDSSADGFAIMNKRYNYNTGKIMPISNGFNFSISTLKSSKSAVIDSKGEQAAEDVIRGRKVYKDFGMGIGKYEKTFTIGKFVGRNALKYAGTIIFTTWDV